MEIRRKPCPLGNEELCVMAGSDFTDEQRAADGHPSAERDDPQQGKSENDKDHGDDCGESLGCPPRWRGQHADTGHSRKLDFKSIKTDGKATGTFAEDEVTDSG